MSTNSPNTYFSRRRNAFRFAWNGIRAAWKNESHIRIHFLAMLLVTVAGLICHLERWEWFAVGACCTLVITIELLNSALEEFCDVVNPGLDPRIKYVKDVLAAAVLMAVVFSVITGVLVFSRHLF
jgi:diacylglycerol kinase